jgi:fatty-acyl-CoA synthase
MLTVMQCVVSGGCMFVHRELSVAEIFRALDEEAIAFALMSPAILREYLLVPGWERQRFASLRAVIYGVSPLGEPTLRRAMEVFGGRLFQFYGTTEANGVTLLGPEDHRRALGDRPSLRASAGRPVLGNELRIVDQDGRFLAPGTRGEIVIKALAPMRGYSHLPEATDGALPPRWMHTGDIGRMDDEGYLYVEDRANDTIVSGGDVTYPFEVEVVLRQHPAVAEVAVIGVPDAGRGEAIKAVVVLRAGASASAGELAGFCGDRLEASKRPRSFDFVDALPKSAFGKVLKRDLRARS